MAEPGTTVGTWLYDIIGTQVRRGDTFYPRRRYLDIVGGALIEDDPVRNSTRITLSGGGGGVGSDRVINTTLPLRIDGGASANLTADRTLSVLDATTTTVGVVKLAADLGGTGLLPEVLKIHGAFVPAAGALTPGHLLQVSAVAALVYGALNLANAASVTNRLSITNIGFDNPDTVLTTNAAGNATQYRKLVDANIAAEAGILVAKLDPGPTDGFVVTRVAGVATWAAPAVVPGSITPGAVRQLFTTLVGPMAGWVTASGDVTIPTTPGAFVVVALRGAAIGTAAPGLTPGTVLRSVTNSTIDYGAVDLANEAAVAGLLAVAHIRPHTAAAILITNGALATEWSTTIPGGLFPALAGDVTGSPGANTHVRIRGALIGTAAGALVTGQSMRATGVAACDWGPVDLANGNAITGLLPVTNLLPIGVSKILIIDGAGVVQWATGTPGSSTLAGDVTGPNGSNVVERIHGATVPIAGALVVGNIPQVTGVSALSYGPLNLAGGVNFVTGALPLTNIAQGGAADLNVMTWVAAGTPQWTPRAISTLLPPSASAVQVFPDMPTLESTSVVPFTDGIMAIVQTPWGLYRLNKTGAPATTGDMHIPPANPSGRWESLLAA
ncbi:MAG TPA: hypothetical protein VK540_29690 [Polyangiaceae bacterium]|nr:hypothetical protein [Polyangiaceae bacterium]